MCDMGDPGLVHIARSVSEMQFLHSLVETQEKGKVITENKYIFAAADARQKSHLCRLTYCMVESHQDRAVNYN